MYIWQYRGSCPSPAPADGECSDDLGSRAWHLEGTWANPENLRDYCAQNERREVSYLSRGSYSKLKGSSHFCRARIDLRTETGRSDLEPGSSGAAASSTDIEGAPTIACACCPTDGTDGCSDNECCGTEFCFMVSRERCYTTLRPHFKPSE